MRRSQKAILVAGLGFGDEGKGSTVDYLTRKHDVHTIIRYNGGAQPIHNVISPDGRHHAFAQFGSGMLVAGTRTHLSRFMLINPLNMLNEELYLRVIGVNDALFRTTIDGDAPIITPFHRAKNQLLEIARGDARHGSCGMGVGQTMEDFLRFGEKTLFVKDLSDKKILREKLSFLQEQARLSLEEILEKIVSDKIARTDTTMRAYALLHDSDIIEELVRRYKGFAHSANIVDASYCKQLLHQDGVVIFEGAQGVLLDRNYGFHPYKTKTDITFANAYTLLNEASYTGNVLRVGVLRGYATRHGQGPFVTEDKKLTKSIPDFHNGANEWQGSFRIGHFDLVATRYALDVIGGVDQIALTNLDRMKEISKPQVCTMYQLAMPTESHFVCKGDTAQLIRVERPSNIDHQALLTKYLETARPIYRQYSKIKSQKLAIQYAKNIGRELGVPISVVSFGPTSKDKIEINN